MDRLVDRLSQRLPCKHEDLGVDGDPSPCKDQVRGWYIPVTTAGGWQTG